ncbi:DUF1330 domain-containing protein [Pseudomonas sp. LRF_L74]|uniref:DUF1330 domain-containing protein n=1 Tax=Pseudomonas sp. LRF_L74 TaxID=3369422 RepID=UPI003F605AC6
MKGYWIILGSEVRDPQAQQEYGRLWKPIAEKYAATLKVLDAGALQESNQSSRVLAVEFASYADAKACYDDPAYAQARAFALRAASRELIIIEADLA